jgi:uncharacterized membrane protein YidH (DUF202 family)
VGLVVSVADASARTRLAWERSGLSFVITGFTMVRGVQGLIPSRPLAGSIVLALGLGVWGLFTWTASRRGAQSLAAVPRPARLTDIAPLAAGTVVIGLAALAIEVAS